MASNNRATLINRVVKIAKKHYKPVAAGPDRSVFEQLMFACLVQNSEHAAAEQVFRRLQDDYFDWNEVRVSSIRELAELMKPLNDPREAATRLRRVLHSVFESLYSFDLEPMKKQNIGQAIKTLEKYNGSDAFTVAYVVQNGLSGHAIPVNPGLLRSLLAVGVVSKSEAAKGSVPGLERAVPKNKGVEVGSLLHQIGVEMHRNRYGQNIRKLLLEIDPDCKDRLPKRPSKKQPAKPEPAAKPAKKAAAKKAPAAEPKKPPAAEPKKAAAKKPAAKKAPAAKAPAKKAPAKKKPTKKVKKKVKKKVAKKKPAASKPAARKSTPKKKVKKAPGKKLAKRKPR